MKNLKSLMLIIMLILTACGSNENKEAANEPTEVVETKTEENTKETPTVDDIEIVDVMNGSGTESIGQMSYRVFHEAEATDEYLKEWANEVKPLGHNWDVLIYKETLNDENPKGAYYSSNMIEKGVFFKMRLRNKSKTQTFYKKVRNYILTFF